MSTTYQYIHNLSDEEYAQSWEQWHRKREEQLNSQYGWLSLRSIDWLPNHQTVTIQGFPGSWTQHEDTVIYTPEPGHEVTNRGQVLTEPITITVNARADVNVEDFDYEGVRAQLIKRIGDTRTFAVRQRDPESITRKSFNGVPHFSPNKKWVVPARYVPLEKASTIETTAVLGDLSHDETAIGTLYVQINGTDYSLIVFQGHNDDSGWTQVNESTGEIEYLDNRQDTDGKGFILFKDATSGKETYGGARAFGIDISSPEDVTYLDFNKATNLPCAFTYYCTCPLAPPENIFPISITAGEKTPVIVDQSK